jgi:site-specific DNA recombinase
MPPTDPASPARTPQGPAIEQVRRDLAHVLDHGTPGHRKAIIETHIAGIKIEDDQLVPIFKIPTGNDERPAEEPADREPDTTFRTTVHVVGRAGLEPATEGL